LARLGRISRINQKKSKNHHLNINLKTFKDVPTWESLVNLGKYLNWDLTGFSSNGLVVEGRFRAAPAAGIV
jgi:hypothetical protein